MSAWWLTLAIALLPGAAPAAERTPVLVELFTSEGCSSCPPADALLSRLHREQPVDGVEVIALSRHVDYWNDLGWTDPFSSADATVEQRRYADAFGLRSVYTPQLVVDGRAELAGGDEVGAVSAIRSAAAAPKARLALAPLRAARARPRDSVRYRVEIAGLAKAGLRGKAEVVLAIVEDDLRSDVRRGENAGRSLRHDCVVRELRVVAEIAAGQDSVVFTTPGIRLPDSWERPRLRAVAFLRERRTGRVLGAATSRPGS